jgi:hypothetical protein
MYCIWSIYTYLLRVVVYIEPTLLRVSSGQVEVVTPNTASHHHDFHRLPRICTVYRVTIPYIYSICSTYRWKIHNRNIKIICFMSIVVLTLNVNFEVNSNGHKKKDKKTNNGQQINTQDTKTSSRYVLFLVAKLKSSRRTLRVTIMTFTDYHGYVPFIESQFRSSLLFHVLSSNMTYFRILTQITPRSLIAVQELPIPLGHLTSD